MKCQIAEARRARFVGSNIPVVIIEVDIFFQTSVILPYLARVRITIATAQVIRDRRSAAACVVIVIVEGFQRGRTELGAIETIKVERRRISVIPLQLLGSERGWGGGVIMLSGVGESILRLIRQELHVPQQSRYHSRR